MVVRPGRIVRALWGILFALILLNAMVAFGHLVLYTPLGALTMLFDMDREANVPTLYNILLFLFAALLFYLVGRATAERGRHWYLLAAVFLFLGIDEGAQIHERFMVFTLKLMGGGEVKVGNMGLLFFAWIIPYGIAAVLLALVLGKWLFRLDPAMRNRLLLSAACYGMGAVGVEAISGDVAESLVLGVQEREPAHLPCGAYQPGTCYLYADPRFVGLYSVEEALEMSGLVLCIRALLLKLGAHVSAFRVTVA